MTYRPENIRLVLVGLVLPILIAFSAAVAMITWLPELPDGVGVGLVVGSGAWFLLPRADADAGYRVEPSAIAVSASQRVHWSRGVRMSRWVAVIAGAAVLIAVVVVVLTALTASGGLGFAVAVLVVVGFLTLATASWHVTVDARGLRVRSGLGWPRITIPIAEIAAVHVVDVNPVADFGGWGWRWAPGGRSGIIMQAGEAIEVTKRSGKRLVVTVDDAATGAGVLAGLTAH